MFNKRFFIYDDISLVEGENVCIEPFYPCWRERKGGFYFVDINHLKPKIGDNIREMSLPEYANWYKEIYHISSGLCVKYKADKIICGPLITITSSIRKKLMREKDSHTRTHQQLLINVILQCELPVRGLYYDVRTELRNKIDYLSDEDKTDLITIAMNDGNYALLNLLFVLGVDKMHDAGQHYRNALHQSNRMLLKYGFSDKA